MIDIQKIARGAGIHIYPAYTAAFTRFAALIREAVVQELVAGSGEPVAWMKDMGAGVHFDQKAPIGGYYGMCEPLFTRDQLAGAIARERERCAKVCDARERPNLYGIRECAAAIRSGE